MCYSCIDERFSSKLKTIERYLRNSAGHDRELRRVEYKTKKKIHVSPIKRLEEEKTRADDRVYKLSSVSENIDKTWFGFQLLYVFLVRLIIFKSLNFVHCLKKKKKGPFY